MDEEMRGKAVEIDERQKIACHSVRLCKPKKFSDVTDNPCTW